MPSESRPGQPLRRNPQSRLPGPRWFQQSLSQILARSRRCLELRSPRSPSKHKFNTQAGVGTCGACPHGRKTNSGRHLLSENIRSGATHVTAGLHSAQHTYSMWRLTWIETDTDCCVVAAVTSVPLEEPVMTDQDEQLPSSPE